MIKDIATKTYQVASPSDPSRTMRFKFFTDYRLGGKRLKIFDFSETIIHHLDLNKFIITRLNEFTNEMEIHFADASFIQKQLDERSHLDSQSIIEIPSIQKERIELEHFKKIISINIQEKHFIIVLPDRLLKYHLESLVTDTKEKAQYIEEIIYKPFFISLKPYISVFLKETLYLFQKNSINQSKTSQIIIHYKTIDCKSRDKLPQNQKIVFKSPKVVQTAETILSSIEKVKIFENDRIILKVYTEFQSKNYIQKIISDPGESTFIKYCKQKGQKPDFGYIQRYSNKKNEAQQKATNN
ncbi:unnamed protein product [Paramecium sonneborni]|uniref:Uncharacterized protein n=1 Tax=Paramecium sonneborni TaxID=65129 RepID=A0A8S1RJH1_9CILI|nr:unnamed protein product [Paramecium sonneborni]